MREQEVTLAVDKFLKKNNWEILSLNNPFSGKSVWIKPKGGFRGKGTLIPDIIARKDNLYLIVESYERLKIKDISKLEKYSTSKYLDSIKEIFEDNNLSIVKIMAYPEPIKEHEYPDDFVVFGVNEDSSVNVYKKKNNKILNKEKFKINNNVFI
jgi:hypothetical protein